MADEARSSRVGFSRILGLWESLALGFSISFGLVLVVAGSVVLSIAADGALVDFALAGVLFLPIILTYAEMAAGRPGSASALQISRDHGSTTLTFLVGWLMLSGLVSAAATLTIELGNRLGFAVQRFFQVEVDVLWLLIAAVLLAAFNEWLASEDRWRTRTVLVWCGFGLLLFLLIRAAMIHPPSEGYLDRIQFRGQDMTPLALLAAGLWYIDLLLNHRRQMRRPDHTLRVSMLGVWVVTIVMALVIGSLVLRSPALAMENWPEEISWGEARIEILLLVVGVFFIWLGLARVVTRTVRLTGAMATSGFFPTMEIEKRRSRLRALLALILLSTAIVVAARWVPEGQLLAVSAASFLVVTVLVTYPHARRPARELSPDRRNRLPFHPLVPGLAIALSISMATILPRIGQGILAAWTVVGALIFVAYGRRRSSEVLQEETLVGEIEDVRSKESPRILMGVGNVEQLPSLLELGGAIARQRDAELVVLRVLETTDELSMFTAQSKAEQVWEVLDKEVADLGFDGDNLSTLVRIAPSVEAGLLSTAREYDVDLLLLGAETLPREAPPSAVLSGVFSSTARPMLTLRGEVAGELPGVVVGTSGGPHAHVALEVGRDIARSAGSRLELVSVVSKEHTREQAEEAIRVTQERAAFDEEIASRIIEADTVEKGLLEAAKDDQILVLGASVDRLLRRTVVGGLPTEIARVRGGATLVAKRAEAAMRFWQRRVWEILARNTPTLTVPERAYVYSQMRHWAKANVDFYTLVSLSSAIAILGLLLDSAAVIIGAMLVAPLMNPILATAQGIVQGNPRMIQRAGASTFKGMSVAIAVSTVIAAIQSNLVPTGEILARTSPNLLDLGVALAAGAAAAYASSRSSVASALPGVAISVALVPPLCVVGYGLGTSQFWISAGAFLLFLTNLAAIILAGALILVLLGFRPTRVELEAHVRKAAVITSLAVALLIIPLGLATMRVTRKHRLEARIEHAISLIDNESYDVREFKVDLVGKGYLVTGTIFAFQGFETERIYDFQEELEREVGVPVRLQLAVVPATLTAVGGVPKGQSVGGSEVVPSEPD